MIIFKIAYNSFLQVMNQFSIPTFDQVLTLDGRTITDNEATLGQLRFYPGCLVLVTVSCTNVLKLVLRYVRVLSSN